MFAFPRHTDVCRHFLLALHLLTLPLVIAVTGTAVLGPRTSLRCSARPEKGTLDYVRRHPSMQSFLKKGVLEVSPCFGVLAMQLHRRGFFCDDSLNHAGTRDTVPLLRL